MKDGQSGDAIERTGSEIVVLTHSHNVRIAVIGIYHWVSLCPITIIRALEYRRDDPLHVRICGLASSLKREELLTLDADTILRRLFWEEDVRRFEPLEGETGPRFACTCSRERVSNMLRSLGRDEIESIIAEQGQVEVGCDFCGAMYRFDPVDVDELFTPGREAPPASGQVH